MGLLIVIALIVLIGALVSYYPTWKFNHCKHKWEHFDTIFNFNCPKPWYCKKYKCTICHRTKLGEYNRL